MKTIALLLAFTLYDPEGLKQEETIHVLSRHFDTMDECKGFISSWGEVIQDRGPEQVNALLKDGYKVELEKIGCTTR